MYVNTNFGVRGYHTQAMMMESGENGMRNSHAQANEIFLIFMCEIVGIWWMEGQKDTTLYTFTDHDIVPGICNIKCI